MYSKFYAIGCAMLSDKRGSYEIYLEKDSGKWDSLFSYRVFMSFFLRVITPMRRKEGIKVPKKGLKKNKSITFLMALFGPLFLVFGHIGSLLYSFKRRKMSRK